MLNQTRVSSKHIPELDGIRGAAILTIILYHYLALEGSRLPLKLGSLLSMGWTGVDLFFVLSGFLIGGILLDARASENYFQVFYARRFCRILPLYSVLCVMSLIVFRAPLSTHPWLFAGRTPWYAYLTFGQNFWMVKTTANSAQLDATWSLAVEEQFYLSLPIIIRFVRYKTLPYLLGVGIILAPLIRTAIWISSPIYGADATYMLAPCRMDALLLGVLAALAVRERHWLTTNKFVLGSLSVLFGAGILEIIHAHIARESLIFSALGYTWIACFCVSLLLLAVTNRGIVSTVFRFTPLMKLGVLAYGLYLFHQPVLGLVYGLARHASPSLKISQWPTVGLTCLSALLVYGLAHLSWTYFEQPLVKRSHRYRYLPPAVAVARKEASAARITLQTDSP